MTTPNARAWSAGAKDHDAGGESVREGNLSPSRGEVRRGVAGARTDLLPVLPLVLSDGAAEDVILRCEGAGPGGQRSVSERERSSDATKEDFGQRAVPCTTTASKTRCFEREIPSSETRRSRHRAPLNARRGRVGVSFDVSRHIDA